MPHEWIHAGAGANKSSKIINSTIYNQNPELLLSDFQLFSTKIVPKVIYEHPQKPKLKARINL